MLQQAERVFLERPRTNKWWLENWKWKMTMKAHRSRESKNESLQPLLKFVLCGAGQLQRPFVLQEDIQTVLLVKRWHTPRAYYIRSERYSVLYEFRIRCRTEEAIWISGYFSTNISQRPKIRWGEEQYTVAKVPWEMKRVAFFGHTLSVLEKKWKISLRNDNKKWKVMLK